jgi:vitamin B12 transporter
MYIGGLIINDLSKGNPVTEDYIDLKARISYRITKGLEIFVRGANLLNQDYETMQGFPEPGITVLGGLSWSVAAK